MEQNIFPKVLCFELETALNIAHASNTTLLLASPTNKKHWLKICLSTTVKDWQSIVASKEFSYILVLTTS